MLDPMTNSVRPSRGQAGNTAGSLKPLISDWLPVHDSHPGQELSPLHKQAEDTTASRPTHPTSTPIPEAAIPTKN